MVVNKGFYQYLQKLPTLVVLWICSIEKISQTKMYVEGIVMKWSIFIKNQSDTLMK